MYMVKTKEQRTVDNKLCLQISAGKDDYGVDKLLEFAPDQNEHCYYAIYGQLHDLAEFYIDDYKAQDDTNDWFNVLYDFIVFGIKKKEFQDNHLDSEYENLDMLKDIIDDSREAIIEGYVDKIVEDEERLYINCMVDIFKKHDNITESFVKYICGRYCDSLRLIENGKVYNYESN